jgi:thiol-disulfide isomerase/thioredoxin
MRRIFAALLTAPLLSAMLPACASSPTTGSEISTDFAPFQATDISGRAIDLAPHVGRDVLVVSFWATWCEPCKAEMPFLQSFHERYEKDGLVIVSVSIDGPDTAAEVAPYVRKQGFGFPVIVDEDGALAQRLNPASTAPYVLVIDRTGKVVKRVAGFQPSEAKAFEADLKGLLGLAP